ncbi:MAG: 16S rRNA processing protein RimM [Firmicutes bacterium]|nr:16S rRNA processing protein RimM [Bacillota bacterium]
MHEYLEIGKIVSTHGVRGEVKVIPLTDDPKRYYKLKWVYVGNHYFIEKYNIENIRISGNTVILKFKEANDMNKAELLKGLFVKVDRKHAVKLPEDTFFICDLIGCTVYEESDGRKLGILDDVIKTGSNDVYVIKAENGKEILIPALKSVVKKVLIKDKKMWVLLPEGLVEDGF